MSIKAVVVVRPGVAETQDIAYPTLTSPDHMIVQVKAVAANPSDWKHVGLEGDNDCTGCVVGADYAGVVVETGSAVDKFKKGDRVAGIVNGSNTLIKEDGAYAEYVVPRADRQIHIPEHMSFADAATQGVALATICLALYRDLSLPLPNAVDTSNPSPVLLIYGGSTAMGITAIQFAKLSNAIVIATCSPSNFEYVKSLGADHVLDYNSPNLLEEIHKLANGQLDLALDCWATEETATLCAKSLKSGGVYSSLGLTQEAAQKANSGITVHWTLAYVLFDRPYWFFGEQQPSLPDIERYKSFLPLAEKLLAEGKVKPPRVFLNRGGEGLEGAIKGLDEAREGNVRGGKLVYTL